MNNCSANKKSSKRKCSKKQNLSANKTAHAQTEGDLRSDQPIDKCDINKSAAHTMDKGEVLRNSQGQNELNLSNKNYENTTAILCSEGSKEGNRTLTSSLLNALKALRSENGSQDNELFKNLLHTTFKTGPGLLTAKLLRNDIPPALEAEGSDDDDGEYVEYVFTPRRYFIYSICEFCKMELQDQVVPCKVCNMTFYCSPDDMERDISHKQLCIALRQIANNRGEFLYCKLGKISPEEYRAYRVMTMNNCEQIIQRQLQPFEREILIFPRICAHCREWRSECLKACKLCGQVYCKTVPDDIHISHRQWCGAFALLRKLIKLQEKNTKVSPVFSTAILKELPKCKSNMKEVLKEIESDYKDDCGFAAITQIASAPLTIYYGLRLIQQLDKEILTIHLIGAEMQFEGDSMQKWEMFLLHLVPAVKELNIVFVGPELVPVGISLQPFIKNKLCLPCSKSKRTVNLSFIDAMYHDYCATLPQRYKTPNLICFFNPGLYRTTGYNYTDSWPATIKAVSRQKCPVLITSYTEYESPLDLRRFMKESDRPINIILPPIQNPFSSCRPERNFISDEMVPLIFKNFFTFMVE